MLARPPSTATKETPYTILSRTREAWNGTLEQAQTLISLHYPNGSLIIDLKRPDVITEIIGMLQTQTFDSVIQFLMNPNLTNPDFLLWEQKSMDEGRLRVARELMVQQTEEEGVKDVGKCRHCASNELVYKTRQTRSSDEPLSVFVRCVQCQKQWRE